MIKKACINCVYWQYIHTGIETGLCKKSPPVIVSTGKDETIYFGRWPATVEDDWCAEWEPKVC
jgi:hypothetical protein